MNGWRAVSILIVIISHLALIPRFKPRPFLTAYFFDGQLGVRMFFVISGFLITYLLVKEEQQTGFVSLRRFYIRRCLRILPVAFAYLLLIFLLQLAGWTYQPISDWVQLLTFTRNFYQLESVDFCSHFWSLAVEEQFYLVWPVLFLIGGLLAGKAKARAAILSAAVGLSLTWQVLALLNDYPLHLYFLFEPHSTFLFLDCLAYGCMAAIIFGDYHQQLAHLFGKHSFMVVSFGLILMIFPSVIHFCYGLQNLGFVILLVHSVLFPQLRIFNWLNHKLLMKVGIISYSLYMWQQIVYSTWCFPSLWVFSIPVVFLAGWLSYRWIETPFHKLRRKFRTA